MRVFCLFLLSIACVLFSSKLFAQDTIFYSMRFSNARHHEAEISITYENVQTPFLKLNLSNYSPGRYANHEFGKNVYGVKAFSAADQPLEVEKTKPNEWLVKVIDGYVKVNYTLFADHADGTYSGIDRKFVNLNVPSAFIWAAGTENNPVKLTLNFPEKNEWKVATQLKELKKNEVYAAPGFYYFIDSPIVLGAWDKRQVYHDKNTDIHLVINPNEADSVEDRYAEMVHKVILEEREVFNGFPAYDYGQYTFLCSYGPGFYGDGMEHRNSTMISSSRSLSGNEMDLIGTVAHEFFHCWNVERLRPKSLEPFDLLNPSVCGELWFAEGFTSYYGPLALRRSGIYSDSSFTVELSQMLNYVMLSPGTGKYSPVEMSGMAPFVDASSFNDPTNFQNTFTSYYPYGAVLALALDLELRSRFDLSLDNFMKAMWRQFGEKEIPYTNEDLKNVLGEYTRDVSFANDFFNKYIYGTELPDFNVLLKNAGFTFRIANNQATDVLRAKYDFDDGAVVFRSKPVETSTWYVAGLNQDDQILSINGNSFSSPEEFYQYLVELHPGEALKVVYRHLGQEYEGVTIAKQDFSRIIVDNMKSSSGSVTKEQEQFRKSWLSSRVKN